MPHSEVKEGYSAHENTCRYKKRGRGAQAATPFPNQMHSGRLRDYRVVPPSQKFTFKSRSAASMRALVRLMKGSSLTLLTTMGSFPRIAMVGELPCFRASPGTRIRWPVQFET